jgi:RNA polymerase sigma factor (sigma-70 family)
MALPQPNAALECIRSMLAEANAANLSDRELLERFATRHDDGAFRAVLRRHGPMVLRVCQQALERQEDAEDVFQATFLVLAQKAGSLNWRESVGTWLYQVAHRLTQEARRKHRRRQAREARARPRSVEDPLAEITGRELVAILDEELASLPEQYRVPLFLCCVEGKSGDEAARQLGCSPSTLKRRLQHARKLLHRQLDRRGFALSMVALSALLLHSPATASVPAALAESTVRAAALVALGQPLSAGVASAPVVALAGGMAQAWFAAKLKIALAVLLLTGTGILIYDRLAGTRAEAEAANGAIAPDGAWRMVSAPAGEWNERQAERDRAGQLVPQVNVGNDGVIPLVLEPPLPVAAGIETTLATAADRIRQFAFDGDPDTFFVSAQDAGAADHFTLVLDQPVALRSVTVTTGRPGGGDALDAGTLEISADGRTFGQLTKFVNGTARGLPKGRKIRAIRIKPTADLRHPLAIREVVIESRPAVEVFKHPVEFIVDVDDAPEMREWAERAARVCERAYPMICEELHSDRFTPPTIVNLALRDDYEGIAKASGGRVIGSVNYFQTNPDDVGALVHTTAYTVQAYQTRNNPRWLVGGIADYIRFFKYEPGKRRPINLTLARYDGTTRMTAAFLAYLVERYDNQIVRKLNEVMRDGEYDDEVFEDLTGKTLPELADEWRASLRR